MNHQRVDVNELISNVKAKLRSTGYSDLCIEKFTAVWNDLTDYMVRNGKTLFTAKAGMDFLEDEYEITVYEKLASQKKNVVPGQSIY